MDEEGVHNEVGKNSRKEEPNILWAAANFPRATIVLVHVHWPSKWMPFMGGGVLYKFADEKEKERHRGKDTAATIKMLSKYKRLCGTRKVSAYYLTHHDIVVGVVSLEKKLKLRELSSVQDMQEMSTEEVLRRCCQVWVVLTGKHISTSNDHVEHSLNFGYGESSVILASIDEWDQKCRVGTMDLSANFFHDVQDDETLTGKVTEKSSSYEMGTFYEEGEEAAKIWHTPGQALKGLLWEDRIRILSEQRNTLKYLHSRRPNAIIHADLKLTNILLDGDDMSRLGDFRTARMVHVKPLEEETIIRRTNPMATIGYMDPVFFTTGELLTTESDVYAFGVVIMQLLTGLDSLNIAEKVRGAVKMHSVLDKSAGPWPEVDTERLLKLALRCCSLERKQRPGHRMKGRRVEGRAGTAGGGPRGGDEAEEKRRAMEEGYKTWN
ncbi:putative protein kinase superfamily protein [Panicum miliaceum]|uniref:RING-type E3 ubiquitin transferase n=1 Tax=Panicum miliaceum TaxID=4540 RepID=A0A3L6PXD9_PANMI|nr:putative protein kinase superfamily protein [Panicum miliaceum]